MEKLLFYFAATKNEIWWVFKNKFWFSVDSYTGTGGGEQLAIEV